MTEPNVFAQGTGSSASGPGCLREGDHILQWPLWPQQPAFRVVSYEYFACEY